MQPLPNLAKITPPQLLTKRILARPRLTEILKQHQDSRLLLILGQAAQGKSTLAAAHVDASDLPTAWINLGPEDGDPVNLFYLLVQSLQQVLPETDLSSVLAYPSLMMGPREEVPLYRDWILAIFALIPTPMQVVFDGLDRLAPEAPSHVFLQVLLDYAPPGLRLIMLSRELPPLQIHDLQMRREAYLLTNQELAFTRQETGEFFRTVLQLPLPLEQIRLIHRLTEGWVGGLVLLGFQLNRLPEEARAEYLAEARFKGEVFQYFGDSLFPSRPTAEREFLLKSAVLEVVEPGLAGELTGLPDASEVLQDLVRKNLFVTSVYDRRRGWLFRYHQLFREFLQSEFAAAFNQEQQQAVYGKAGDLLAARGDLEEALPHYLQARAYPRAALALEGVGLDLVKLGRIGDLARWLEALPPDLVRENPWLLFYSYMTKRFKFSPEALDALQQALARFEDRGEVEGTLHCLAYLIEAGGLGFCSILAPLLVRAEALLQSLPPDRYPYELTALWLYLGAGLTMRGGSPRRAFRACQNAYLLARDLGDLPLQLQALTYSAFCLTTLGEFPEAARFWEKADRLAAQCAHPEPRGLYLLLKAHAAMFRGDFDQAGALARRGEEEVQRHGLAYLFHYVQIGRMITDIFLGNHAGAEETGKGLGEFAAAAGNPFSHAMILQLHSMNYYQKGELRTARDFAARSRENFYAAEAHTVHHLQMANIHMCLIDVHLGEITPDTEGLIQEGLAHWRNITAYLWMVDAHSAMALLKWAQGNQAEAAAHLQTAFSIAQERGYHHFFLLSRRDLLELSIMALELELQGLPLECACRFLTTKVADLAGPELERLSHQANPRVAAKAGEVRRLVHRARLPRLRVETLGGFKVWRGDSILSDSDWEGQQTQLLLKALIARGCQQVPLEALMEDLWPEAAPETGKRNLTVGLHRLRKALEPALDKTFGSAYVHLKTNLVCLDQELCQVDVPEFLSLCRDGEKKDREGDLAAAVALYQEAAQRYQGDFLPEEPYLPWAESRREELKGRYVEVLERLAQLYEKRGAMTKAIHCLKQLLKADPLWEPAYQKLMLLYARRGLRAPALKVYEDCQKALRQGLDAAPDPATTAIYRKILTSS
jgi:ATP/maltotriose-dependent transcriptional regulator MalT